ncbi:hypothetical protein [Nocardioides euryhalodurans]|uniref:Uncharacterized protein n=1 Tax=Nocardioides euryhalodurans TaxID=2518370 RepID=A0A4P7GMP5_9ACTN|nr:hypothetical protein [Nocardioides euryhalodurans]QBR93290.1 hypothetical protein EXE57_14225 [Nocardioides euryhalodurans]
MIGSDLMNDWEREIRLATGSWLEGDEVLTLDRVADGHYQYLRLRKLEHNGSTSAQTNVVELLLDEEQVGWLVQVLAR